jgi:protein Tex
MTEILSQTTAGRLGIPYKSVLAVQQLLENGATIPFIARYRKESTGGLDEVELRRIESSFNQIRDLISRKEYIKSAIDSQGKLTDDLVEAIDLAGDLNTLEDLYLPFKKKRKTRAAVARELGLEPLADKIWTQGNESPETLARQYLTGSVQSTDDALAGASDILSERIAELPWVRQSLRHDFQKYGILISTLVKSKEASGVKYSDYFAYEEKITRCPSHRLLAILRGENEGFLRVQISIDEQRSLLRIKRRLIKPHHKFHSFLEKVVDESYKRLIAPSLENETRNFFKEKADEVAIGIFSENLRQLLLAAPLGEKNVLAIDPGFRTGCKVVVLNRQGDLLHHTTIYPHPPQQEAEQAIRKTRELCTRYQVEAVAVGNGTAGRETMQLLKKNLPGDHLEIFLVNESGASIYSASDVAREEFPDYDVTVRGAISIGRRLMDPLAELVKIEPKSIGVGQYQHDVNQRLLQDSLEKTVISCVNKVGVNLNTASQHLLQYIAGLGISLAKNIVDYRRENGPFTDRQELLKVSRLGAKAYEQCAGFLRIRNGQNPLDDSSVHPESYPVVEKMAKDLQCTVPELIRNVNLQKKLDLTMYVDQHIGLPTLKDILSELEKPGLDPRGEARPFEFHSGIQTITDLEPGMQVPGLVTNITKFGAFVNIGLKQDGLVHISQTGGKTLQLEDQILVKVMDVDLVRNRINLKYLEHL